MNFHRREPYSIFLGGCLLGAAAALMLQPPFAFYSPDVSYHAARLHRATGGDYWIDPFAGTKSAYPSLFHAAFGVLNRVLQLDAFDQVRLIEVVNLVGLFAGFHFLARTTIPGPAYPSLATLALSLVMLAPTGRYALLANPVNFSLVFLFFGSGFLWRYLGSDRRRDWTLGLLLVGVAINVVWYMAAGAAGLLFALLAVLRREGRLNARRLAPGLLALAAPCTWTAVHLWTIREVLPDYFGPARSLVSFSADPAVFRNWVVTYLTRWNVKFMPQMWRSGFATVHYLGLVLPFSVALVAVGTTAFWRGLPRSAEPHAERARTLYVAAAAIFALSLPMAMTGDLGRVAWIQLPSFALLLLFVFRALPAHADLRGGRLARAALAAAGALALAYTVLHSPRGRPGIELTRPTRMVVEFIASLPDPRNTRIFATERNLRLLTPFVSFLGFVNHGSGRYHSQDPISSDRMRAAYDSIVARDPWSEEALEQYHVEFMAFRHASGGLDAELAAAYAHRGEVMLRNREWIVVKLLPARRP